MTFAQYVAIQLALAAAYLAVSAGKAAYMNKVKNKNKNKNKEENNNE